MISTSSPAVPRVTRSWKAPDAFVQEVADARIYDGGHYRDSADVGTSMGSRSLGLLSSAPLGVEYRLNCAARRQWDAARIVPDVQSLAGEFRFDGEARLA